MNITKELLEKEEDLFNRIKNGEDINIEGIKFYVVSAYGSLEHGESEVTLTIRVSHNQ